MPMAHPQPTSQTVQERNRDVQALKHYAPLHEFRQKYCRNCPDIEFCKVNFENHLLCLIAKLTLEITGQNNLTIKLNSHKF